jgi:hypothetical protein
MEPRLTRGEYWLLNCVVDSTCPLSFLINKNIEELFNNPGHRLDRSRLVETLVSMSESGWIEGHRLNVGLPLTKDLIEAGFAEVPWESDDTLCYRMSAEGGAIWEAFAVPDWDRYLAVGIVSPGEWNEFFGATRWRLEKYLSLLHYDGIDVMPETVVWDEVAPWQATYWKQLPHGYRVQFKHRERHHDAGVRDLWLTPNGVYSLQKWYDWD